MIVSFPLSGPLYSQPAFVITWDTEALEYVLLMLSCKYTRLVFLPSSLTNNAPYNQQYWDEPETRITCLASVFSFLLTGWLPTSARNQNHLSSIWLRFPADLSTAGYTVSILYNGQYWGQLETRITCLASYFSFLLTSVLLVTHYPYHMNGNTEVSYKPKSDLTCIWLQFSSFFNV